MKTFKDTKYGDLTGQVYKKGGKILLFGLKLNSLEGSPTSCTNDFDCSNNLLTSLEHAPTGVYGDFDCSCNQLTSLKHSPQIVMRNYDCSENGLTTLEGVPMSVGVSFNCSNNNLTDLKTAPKNIPGIFNCKKNNIKNVKQQIIENQVKASQYITDEGDFKFFTIEEEFLKYRMLNRVQSKGFRTLLGLDK